MSSKPIVVYGASGYTGRLVAEFLRNYELPFIAAGRNGQRIEEAMALVPGIETAEFDVVEVKHEVSALTELLNDVEVVCNTVGPFDYYGEAVVEAAANANTHYMDTTGEQAFIDRVRKNFGDQFAANGRVLSPSVAYMHTPLEIAAQLVLETPGIDSLECLCVASGVPTYGSTQTIFSMFKTADSAFYIENNQRVSWPPATGYEVAYPGGTSTLLAHPWSGSALPVYFESDARVRNYRQLTTFTNRAMFEQVIALQQMFETEIKELPEEEQAQKLQAIADGIQPGMPPRENALIHRCTEWVRGRGGNVSADCIIRSINPYQVTGILQAAAANFLLNGRQLDAGFVSACSAFGYRELLGQIRNFGMCEVELTTSE